MSDTEFLRHCCIEAYDTAPKREDREAFFGQRLQEIQGGRRMWCVTEALLWQRLIADQLEKEEL